MAARVDRPRPPSGVDDVEHIHKRIQELRREKERVELDKEPFLRDQEDGA